MSKRAKQWATHDRREAAYAAGHVESDNRQAAHWLAASVELDLFIQRLEALAIAPEIVRLDNPDLFRRSVQAILDYVRIHKSIALWAKARVDKWERFVGRMRASPDWIPNPLTGVKRRPVKGHTKPARPDWMSDPSKLPKRPPSG